MARIYKEREIPPQPAKINKYLDRIKCCFCGRETRSDRYQGAAVADWDNSAYEFEIIIIKKASGADYPDTHWGEEEGWDVCPECFEKHIKSILPKDSYKHEWDY